MKRPPVVTTFGFLNIAFSLYGFFGTLVSVAMMFIPFFANTPAFKIMRESQEYMAWLKISLPVSLIGMAVLLASGIGLLGLRPWARRLAIGYAVYAVVFGLVSLVITTVFLLRPLMEQASQQHGPEAAGAMGGAIGGCIAGVLGLIYPVVLFIFMKAPDMVAVFQPPKPPPMPK